MCQALARASKETLTRVIIEVCVASPECLKEVRSRLVKRSIESTNSNSNEPTAKRQKVVETSRYVLCAQCKEEFDTDYNEPKSCERYPGVCFSSPLSPYSSFLMDFQGVNWEFLGSFEEVEN